MYISRGMQMRNVMFLGDSTMQIQTTALGVDWIGQICIFNLKYCRKKLKYKHCRLFIITTAYLLVESFLLSTVRLLSRTTLLKKYFTFLLFKSYIALFPMLLIYYNCLFIAKKFSPSITCFHHVRCDVDHDYGIPQMQAVSS